MKKKTRKRNPRKMSPTVLLFTNGKTEEIYFKQFQRSENKGALRIKPIFTNGEMSSFVTGVKSQLKKPEIALSEVDKVFFVFDFDDHTNDEILRTFKELRDIAGTKTRIYFSNYSFELWLLSHDHEVRGFKDQRQLQSELERIHDLPKGKWQDHKTDTELIASIVSNWQKAIENCQDFDKNLYEHCFKNPWTNMRYLFEEL